MRLYYRPEICSVGVVFFTKTIAFWICVSCCRRYWSAVWFHREKCYQSFSGFIMANLNKLRNTVQYVKSDKRTRKTFDLFFRFPWTRFLFLFFLCVWNIWSDPLKIRLLSEKSMDAVPNQLCYIAKVRLGGVSNSLITDFNYVEGEQRLDRSNVFLITLQSRY